MCSRIFQAKFIIIPWITPVSTDVLTIFKMASVGTIMVIKEEKNENAFLL